MVRVRMSLGMMNTAYRPRVENMPMELVQGISARIGIVITELKRNG